MGMKRRVFMSLTHDSHLDDRQNKVKWGIVQRVIDAGYEPHLFFPAVPAGFEATVHRVVPWTADKVKETIGGAIGAVMIGYPRWKYGDDAHASEFTHYEAGVAHTKGLPMFMVLERGIQWRGAFDQSSSQICEVPQDADESWLSSSYFEQCFSPWRRALDARYDLFLGYSSDSQGTAKNLKRVLETKGARVLDWQDFGPGTILEQIERAAACCTGGVFLFTADDALEGTPGMAAPRDNVVFEAGYFVHAKGHARVLIIRESGEERNAKMPADLGGSIYAPLPNLADIEALDQQLDRFVQNL